MSSGEMHHQHTTRYNGIGDKYDLSRPGYAHKIIGFLHKSFGMEGQISDKVIADIGAGTGMVTELLAGSASVIAIEPTDMRNVLQDKLNKLAIDAPQGTQYANNLRASKAIEGTSSDTNLPNGSVDFIVVGTAAHFFEADKKMPVETIKEFNRILKPEGKVALLQNWLDRDEPIASAFVDLYQSKFNMDWDKLGTFQYKATAKKFLQPDMEERIEKFPFRMNQEEFISFLKSLSETKNIAGKELEGMLNFFNANKVTTTVRGKEEEVLELGYKCAAYIGKPLQTEKAVSYF